MANRKIFSKFYKDSNTVSTACSDVIFLNGLGRPSLFFWYDNNPCRMLGNLLRDATNQ